ncbi:hypothetical protein EXS54_02475 [Patescibacteria group bacterium]|nr:hypothetical protein [Patescibacteria group bacterium]
MNSETPKHDPAEIDSPAERESAYNEFREVVKDTVDRYKQTVAGEIYLLPRGAKKQQVIVRRLPLSPDEEFQVVVEDDDKYETTYFTSANHGAVERKVVTSEQAGMSVPLDRNLTNEELIHQLKEDVQNNELEREMGVTPKASASEINQLLELIASSEARKN